MKIDFKKSELDLIADSLCFREKELRKDISKQKNLNSKKYKDKVKEISNLSKLISDLYEIDNSISHRILFE